MGRIAYLNGTFMPAEEAVVSIDDRGYYFGDGIYEALLAHQGVPYGLEDHLNRWAYSLGEMRIAPPCPREALAAIIREAAERVGEPEVLIYLQATRGAYPRLHAFPPSQVSSFLMLTAQPHPHDVRAHEEGDHAALIEDIRWHRCDVKTINLLPNVLASQQAADAGCTQAILHRGGVVTECASSNAYMVKNGVVYTHPLGHWILPGTTRMDILMLANGLGIPVREEAFSPEALLNGEEAFASSVARRPTPIISVDGKAIGSGKPGPVTRRLQAAYEKQVAQQCGLSYLK